MCSPRTERESLLPAIHRKRAEWLRRGGGIRPRLEPDTVRETVQRTPAVEHSTRCASRMVWRAPTRSSKETIVSAASSKSPVGYKSLSGLAHGRRKSPKRGRASPIRRVGCRWGLHAEAGRGSEAVWQSDAHPQDGRVSHRLARKIATLANTSSQVAKDPAATPRQTASCRGRASPP